MKNKKSICKQVKKCRMCKSKNLKTVFNLEPTPIGDDYRKLKNKKSLFFDLRLNLCQNCNFVQLSNVLNSNIVYGDYIYVTNTSLGLPKHFQNFVKFLENNNFLKKKSRILEIGCNDGTLLKEINSGERFVLGVDPAKNLVNKLKNDFEIIVSDYDNSLSKKINNKYRGFDLIIANNVIANIDNLESVFKGIYHNLNQNGYFVMETFSLYGLLKNNLFDNIYHEHISYFGVETLQKFCKRFNMQLIRALPLKVKGGSIRFIFKKTKQNIKLDKKSNSYLNIEKKFFKNIENKFLRMTKININIKKKIHEYINLKNKNKKISAYGASVGSTTFIYYYDLYKKIDNIYDDESLRFNLYSPGSNIKVLSPKYIMKSKYVIILAWRYAKNIIKKNSYFIKKGGKFIVPLPKFKIIQK